MNASIKNTKFLWYDIKKWDCVVWRKTLSDKLWISQQSIRTSLNHLKSTNEITIKPTKQFSIITVVKYSDYQYIDQDDQPTNQPTNQPTTNQQLTTLKEYYINNREQVKKLLDEEYIQTYAKPLKAMMIMIDMWLVVKENKKAITDFIDRFKEKAKIYNYILPNWNYDFDWMIQRVDRWKTYHQDNNTVIEKHKSSLLQFLDPSRDKKWKRKK